MKIALLGDIALFGCNSVNRCYQERFNAIKAALQGHDYVVGNLETPLTNEKRIVGGKSAYIKGIPDNVEILQYLGITHVSLANNHVLDYREKGLKETLEVLDRAGIEWYGIYGKTCHLEERDVKVCLRGYCCYSTNGKGLGDCVDVFDPGKMEKDIMSDNKKEVMPILSCHWGQEHIHYPNYDHVLTSRKLAKVGKFIIHGHHPHVIQGIEVINQSLIAYSLGNFCFDDVYTKKSKQPLIKLSKDNMETFVLSVEIKNNIVKDKAVIPFAFTNGIYEIKDDIKSCIKKWSEYLVYDEQQYRIKRNKLLSEYLVNRKRMRDIEWYLKRMNPESIRQLMEMRNNHRKYESIVQAYIRL